MDILFVLLGGVCLIVGFIGTVVPILPGAPLAWMGLLISSFSRYTNSSPILLMVTGVVAIAVSVLDNFFPVLMTKQSGGSKYGIIGSSVGLFVGFFTGPWGIIFGPFLGAFVGEMIHDSSDMKHVFESALGCFKGFLLGTGMKMMATGAFIWVSIITLVKH